MFRKEFPAGVQSLLGNKDRKRLREHALRAFPLLKETDFDLLFPPKAEITVLKSNLPQVPAQTGGPQQPSNVPPLLSATSVNKCLLYFVGEPLVPILGDVNGTLFPTVYGLWRVPTMVPSFLVFEPVSSFVLKGADVMLPGVSVQLTAAAAERDGVSQVTPGDFWSVRVAGNKMPFAVGRAVPFAKPVTSLADKGKALSLVHYFGDSVWKCGDRSVPSALFTPSLIKSGSDDRDLLAACGVTIQPSNGEGNKEDKEEEDEDGEDGGRDEMEGAEEERDEIKPKSHEEGDEEGPVSGETDRSCVVAEASSESSTPANAEDSSSVAKEVSVQTMDKYLELCLMEVLNSLSDDQLPLDVSALYSKITTDAPSAFNARVPPSNSSASWISPDLKKSSFKKLAKFMQHATKLKWLQTKEQRKVICVVDINRSHPEYKNFKRNPGAAVTAFLESVGKSESAALTAGFGGGASSERAVVVSSEAAEEETSSAAVQKNSRGGGPLVYEFWMPPSKCSKIFSLAGARTGKEAFFTSQEYHDVLEKYLALQTESGAGSADPSFVELDQFLMEALLTKEERASAKKSADFTLTRQEAFTRWQETKRPCHAVLSDASEESLLAEKIVKGPCNPVLVSVTDRMGGRKHSTNIFNITNFHLDPKNVAEVLQKKLAASATLFAPPGSKATTAISVQGNVAHAVADLITSHFNVPREYVEVEGKKGSSGKR